ncbi:MAG: hypothetical protein Q8P63_01255 [Candidatus Nealsonbacteria bacterium]|nr:hypothetical protein [Candidatus Nealsonbacteria bacterium]
MAKQVSPKIIALTFGVLVISLVIAFYAVAWTEPSQSPPGGNIDTPLNVGSTHQTKEGDLTIGIVDIWGDGSVSTNLNAGKLEDKTIVQIQQGGWYGLGRVAVFSFNIWYWGRCVDGTIIAPFECSTIPTPSESDDPSNTYAIISCPAGYKIVNVTTSQIVGDGGEAGPMVSGTGAYTCIKE